MKLTRTPSEVDLETLPLMPPWVTSGRAQADEDVAFMSGAALSHLHLVLGTAQVPQALLRARLALLAAEACVTLSGRSERAGELRDEVQLLRAGDQPGPAGAIYQTWQRVVAQKVSIRALHHALPAQSPEQIAVWLDQPDERGAGQGGLEGPGTPVDRAACVLEAVLADVPQAEEVALILADATLAQALGWEHLVPLLGCGLKSRDLHASGKDLRVACHRSLVAASKATLQMASDLARRAARLEAVAPKLRAKGAGAAVQLLLSRDAVMPAALPLSDRSARRLCDRLVGLGVVRELTGRDSFRLYGV